MDENTKNNQAKRDQMGVIQSFTNAAQQLPDPRLRRVLMIGIVGSLAIFVLLWIVIWSAVSTIAWESVWGVNWLLGTFPSVGNAIGGVVFTAVMVIVTFLFFPAVITIIVGFFLEEVVQAIEAQHYPNEPAPRPQPLGEVLGITAKFALLVSGLNILFLPIYLLLFLVPPLNLFLYYLLNGYLISREYYELVALRRLKPRLARQLRRQYRGRMLLAGIILVFFMTIPIINFITPVLATAFMVHIYQNLPRREEFAAQTSGAPPNKA